MRARFRLIIAFASISMSMTAIAGSTDGNATTQFAIPDSWALAESVGSGAYDGCQWWQMFDDNLLDSLIEVGLQNNYNAQVAARNIRLAENTLKATYANYSPNLGLNAGWTKSRTSGMTGNTPGSAYTDSYWNGNISMSWEVDVFGRIASQAKANKASIGVSRATYDGVLTSLAATIATDYFQLRVLQAERDVAREHSRSQLDVLNITKARYEASIASKLDVTQAEEVYYSTIASIPTLESSIDGLINSIAILVGDPSNALVAELSTSRPLPDYNHIINAGVPADLLRNRPDIIEAEKQIDVCAANLGVAKKDYLPSLSLTGSIGTTAHSTKDLFKNQSLGYSIAPTLSWTIFDGLARNRNVAAAKMDMENAIDNYNFTVLSAIEETQSAMSSYFYTLKYIANLQDVVNASRESERLSLEKYKGGLAAFINVADAQISYLENRNALIVAQGKALSALVTLQKALGGSWQCDNTSAK